MAKPVRMHVARTPSKYVDKAGNVHRYESVLVRRSYRDGKKVRHETLANLSKTARGGDRRDRGHAEGPDAGARRNGVHHRALPAAWACGGGGGDGPHAG